MSTLIYRNLLIIERTSSHVNFLKSMNIDFDDDTKPFKYVGPLDKIIFYFENTLNDSEDVITISGEFDLNNYNKYRLYYDKWKTSFNFDRIYIIYII